VTKKSDLAVKSLRIDAPDPPERASEKRRSIITNGVGAIGVRTSLSTQSEAAKICAAALPQRVQSGEGHRRVPALKI